MPHIRASVRDTPHEAFECFREHRVKPAAVTQRKEERDARLGERVRGKVC